MADNPQQQNVTLTPKSAYLGLNLDAITSQVKQGQLTWAINALVESWDGNSITYQNEQANVLCSILPEGYKVVGVRNIIEEGFVVFWLANPTTGDSEIGTLNSNTCTYNTTVNDPCINLSIYHPILKSVYKKTNCGTEVYWTDGYNNRRYINFSNLPFKETLDCPPQTTGIVDCNKLEIQPHFSIPEIATTSVDSDGELTAGTYQFAIQYANALSEGYTAYYSITNPTPIFDPLKITQDFNYTVGKSINLTISNIDTTGYFDYINLAVIKTVNNISSFQLVGTYQITSPIKNVTYSGQNKESIRLIASDIFEKFPIYNKAQDLTTAQDVLIWDQLTTDERLSYQEIANNITLKWQTWRLLNNKPYANELNATNLRGYMGDEIYPFEFVPLLTNGKQTDGFTIPGRLPNSNDISLVNNNDVIAPDPTQCNPGSEPQPRWRVYNTGSVTGFTDEYLANQSDPCYEGPYQYGEFSYWESSDVYPCNTIYGTLSGQQIRHHKFPDSTITHIHDNSNYIYPKGVRIDVGQVWDAIQASSLTTEQKANIVGFKIVRGNRANNKSVVAKGLIHNVGKYSRDNQTYYFPNYSYNDLRADAFLQFQQSGNDSGRNDSTRLQAFATDESKERFTLHSPDTSFYQPFLGNILKLETAEWGVSKGHFQHVEGHSRYKFLSAGSYISSLAVAIGIGFASATFGLSNNPFNGTAAWTAYQVILDIINKTSPRINFAFQFNSIGNYDHFVPIPNTGNKQRFVDIATYLSPGMLSIGDTYTVNNFQRESSVYLKTNKTLPYPSSIPTVPLDTSRYVSSDLGCNNNINEAFISSYYASLKKQFDNQYGTIYSYETIDTGFQYIFPAVDDIYKHPVYTIFGGDTFINKFAYKSKIPFFIDNRVKFADEADISYSELGNVAYPNFWFNTDSEGGSTFNILALTLGVPANNLDCDTRPFFYQKGKIYLFSYGIPYFFVESEVNVDLRQAFNASEGDFFPRVSSDIPDRWLQEINTTIQQDNTYFYNKTYSKQNKENLFTHVPDNFLPQDCTTILPFRAIFSEPQKDFVNYRRNNWLIYRPISYYDFPQNYGPLTSLDGIENKAVLARFENKSQIYNALLTAPTSQADVYLGQSLFSSQVPPLDFAETDLGFAGSQHKFLLKTQYGHISCDAKRGQVFLFDGQKANDITDENVEKFFTQYLDFEIKKAFPEINIDNHFNSVGLHGVHDTKYNRIILTKIDYKPLSPDITFSDNKFFFNGNEIQLTDTTYFSNDSFTASYSFKTQGWISFHTYIPNFYIGQANYFQTGLNSQPAVWTHNTEISRYNNFYNSIHPYTLEYPYAYQYNDEILQNVKDYTKAIQYTSWQSFIETDDVFFNKAILYNNQQCSGLLLLTPKPPNNLSIAQKYPIYNTDSKEIVYTKRDNFYQLNTFWGLNKSSKIPIWNPSTQNLSIFKELNQANMDYSKRSFKKEPLRAKDLKIRLTLDNRDDTKLISQFQVAASQQSYI